MLFICSSYNDVSNLRKYSVNDWMTVNNELQRLWKEVIVA